MINQWLEDYNILSQEDLINSKREIMQQVALAGLARGGFFEHATFYGGTALRIFYGLDRYSEDLDFSLNYKDASFSLEKYFDAIKQEFNILGLAVDINLKQKHNVSPVESAFLKENTIWGLITLDEKSRNKTNFPIMKIKIEIDKIPPLLFAKETKVLDKPYSFYVSTMTLPSLFAGKMHAVLFRELKNRVKGRDWYDFVWYVNKEVTLPLNEFLDRAKNSEHLPDSNENLTADAFKELLIKKIENLDIEKAVIDIASFIQNPKDLDIWSKQYFLDLVKMMKVE
ncbi:MAG TPA: nucleotidyl transferase AbiEii/AbiGii toxin family protein [Saprospiraceae bacterium]|nr:nucleotidyl transferase AbiEii/AbiGii toxin family protein [Saprospiraceae bacterium]